MRRVQWIDSARFLAILVIMVGHYLAMLCPFMLRFWEPGQAVWWLVGGITGKLSVAIFFVLLGYYAGKPHAASVSAFLRYALRRYIQLAFFAFTATLLFLLGGYLSAWLFHTPDENVFRILSDGPRYNLLYLLRDGFLLEDHYIDTLWCMRDLFLASLICRLFGFLPERLRPSLRALLGAALIVLLLLLRADFFIWICVALLGCLLRFVPAQTLRSPVRLALLLVSLLLLKLPLAEGPLLFFLEGVIGCIWFLLVSTGERLQHLLSRSPLPWLGRICLGLFVIHTPVYSLLASSLIPLLGRVLPEAALLPLFFPPAVGLCIMGAWLLHRAYMLLLQHTRKRQAVAV